MNTVLFGWERLLLDMIWISSISTQLFLKSMRLMLSVGLFSFFLPIPFSSLLIAFLPFRPKSALILFASGKVFAMQENGFRLAGAEMSKQFPNGVDYRFRTYEYGGWCKLLPPLVKIRLCDTCCTGIDDQVKKEVRDKMK